jgi:hypothetical protein
MQEGRRSSGVSPSIPRLLRVFQRCESRTEARAAHDPWGPKIQRALERSLKIRLRRYERYDRRNRMVANRAGYGLAGADSNREDSLRSPSGPESAVSSSTTNGLLASLVVVASSEMGWGGFEPPACSV